MKMHRQIQVQPLFLSETRPDVYTTCPDLARVMQWADDHPVVWKIVTGTRSKAFGLVFVTLGSVFTAASGVL